MHGYPEYPRLLNNYSLRYFCQFGQNTLSIFFRDYTNTQRYRQSDKLTLLKAMHFKSNTHHCFRVRWYQTDFKANVSHCSSHICNTPIPWNHNFHQHVKFRCWDILHAFDFQHLKLCWLQSLRLSVSDYYSVMLVIIDFILGDTLGH